MFTCIDVNFFHHFVLTDMTHTHTHTLCVYVLRKEVIDYDWNFMHAQPPIVLYALVLLLKINLLIY